MVQRVNIQGVGIVNFPDDMSSDQITKVIETEILKPTQQAKPEETGNFVRGLKSYLPQTQEIIGGGEAILGKAIGSEGLKKAGLENIKTAQAAQQQISKPTDSLTQAWEQGIGAVITDWLPYQAGIGVANIGETLATMGVGAIAGGATAGPLGAIGGGIGGVIEKSLIKKGIKEASEKILKEQGEEAAKAFVENAAKKELSKELSKEMAKKGGKAIGAEVGIGAAAATHGMGEVGSRAIEEAQAQGKSLDDVELSRVLPAAAVHAVSDYVANKIGLAGLKGTISPGGKSILMDIVKNIVVTGSKEIRPEFLQSLAERYGADLSLTDAQAINEYIDTIGAAYGMSAIPGGIGGVRAHYAQTAKTDKQEETPQEKVEDVKTQETAPPATDDILQSMNENIKGVKNVRTRNKRADQSTAGAGADVSGEAVEETVQQTAGDVGAAVDESGTPLGINQAGTRAEQPALINDLQENSHYATGWNDLTKTSRIKLYRGENSSNIKGGDWWTSNREKAAKYGDVIEVDLPAKALENAAMGHGLNDEFVFVGSKKPPELAKIEQVNAKSVQQNLFNQAGTRAEQPALTKAEMAQRDEANRNLAAEQQAAQEKFVSEEPIRAEAMNVAERKRVDQAYKVKTVQATSEDIGKDTVTAYNDLITDYNKQGEGEKGGNLPKWSGLNTAERALYNLVNKTQGPDVAMDMLSGFRTGKREEAPTRAAYIYEANRDTASKEHDIDMPSWQQLSPEAQQAFTTTLKRPPSGVHKGENIHDAFGSVASTLEEENVAYRGMTPAAVTEAQTTLQEKSALDERQRETNVEKIINDTQSKNETLEQTVKGQKPVSNWEQVLTAAAEGANVEKTPGAARVKATSNAVADKILNLLKGFGSDLKFQFGSIPTGQAGQFNPSSNTITIDRNNFYQVEYDRNGNVVNEVSRNLNEVVMHEAVHYALDHVVDNPKKASPAQQKALKELEKIYSYIQQIPIGAQNQTVGNQFQIGTFKEFLAEAMSNAALQNALASIKIVQMSDVKAWKELSGAERKLFGMFQDSQNVFSAFIKRVASALGLRPSDAPVLEGILSKIESVLDDEEYKLPSAEMRGKEISYAGGAKKPKERGTQTPEEMVDSLSDLSAKPRRSTKQIVEHAMTSKAREWAIKKFQNSRVAIKNWQDDLQRAGKIIAGEDGFNNVYDMIVTAFGRATFLQREYLDQPIQALQNTIDTYVAASGKTLDEALKWLHVYAEALHEPERRLAKYVMNVPLSQKKNIKFQGKNISAATMRDNIMNTLALGVNKETAKAYRQYLDWLVANHKDATGHSPAGYKSIDVNSSEYNVIGGRTAKEIQGVLARLNPKSPDYDAFAPQVMAVMRALKPVQDATIELNKKGNYWSSALDGVKEFYGFENYVPFKGRPDKLQPGNIAQLELNGPRLSNELRSFEGAFGGRMSESNNPVVQTMVESTLAVARAGRAGLTQSIKNAVEQKLIPGKVTGTYSFAQRYRGEVNEEELKARNVVLNYNEDGSMDVIEIHDQKLLEAIRRTYQESHPVMDWVNGLTSFIGQTHTRYNPSFPVLNFVRDVLTNSYVIAVEMSPLDAASYLGSVVTKSIPAMHTAWKVSNMFAKGNVEGIRAYAKKNDFAKNMLEYLEHGGQVSVVQGLSVQGQLEQLYSTSNKHGVLKTKQQIDKVFDTWVNMFELSARTAAYMTTKSNLLSKGMSQKQAQEQATVYAKRLANFEEVGDWGKAMGAAFMFFRPSATGAVRATEAISPMLRKWENVEKELPDTIRKDKKALATYKESFMKQSKSAKLVTAALIGMGMAAYSVSAMFSGDDDEDRNKTLNDDMSRWTRYARFPIPFSEDKVVQIPWGFGLGAFAAVGAQMAGMGSNTNMTLGKFIGNVANIAFDSFIPLPISRMNPVDNFEGWIVDTVSPSIIRPFVEHAMNVNGLGQQIYNAQSRMSDAYTSGDNIPDMYKDAAQVLFNITDGAVDITPNSLYFFANNYLDGVTRIAHNGYGVGLMLAGQKEFDIRHDVPLADAFVSTTTNVDAAKFTEVQAKVADMERKINTFKNNPTRMMDYINKHPIDSAIVDFYNQAVASDLKDLQEQAKWIRTNDDFTPKDKTEYLRDNKKLQNMVKKRIVDQVDMIQEFGED